MSHTFEQLCGIFPSTDPKLVRRFWEYHQANRHVFQEFRQRAAEMKAVGRTKYSGWIIINRIRWDHDLRASGDPFKINNDYIALYARLLIHEDPSFNGFFELRKMKPSGRKMSQEERDRWGRVDEPKEEDVDDYAYNLAVEESG
jgi:hypothetical protein